MKYLKKKFKLSFLTKLMQRTLNLFLAEYCLKFWYRMFGNGMGDISVFKKHLNSTKNGTKVQYGDVKRVWKRSRSAGNRWVLAAIDIEEDQPFQVSILKFGIVQF